ncbi:MAG: hypothetical protein KAV44_10275, partial [Bacteroidales bacterium]|nr:hypothetical protein [Bacteroidales bacterium]
MKNFTKISKMIVVVLLSIFAFTQTKAQCDYEIALYDSWGDGWNGGQVSVFVDGTEVLDDITLASGTGPEFHTFPVATGSEITTDYVAGSFSSENMYEIIDSEGNVVWTEGAGSATPGDIGPGMLFATCPSPPCDYEIAL